MIKRIGNYVRNKRLLVNLTQAQLAVKSKVSPITITRLECGSSNIELRGLVRVLDALGVTKEIAELFTVKEVAQQRVHRSIESNNSRNSILLN